MRHPFDLANLIAGDHRLANILFERLERDEDFYQVLVDQMILNVAVHAGGEEMVFYPADSRARLAVSQSSASSNTDAEAEGMSEG